MGKNVFTFLLIELFRCKMSDSKSEGSGYHTTTEEKGQICSVNTEVSNSTV